MNLDMNPTGLVVFILVLAAGIYDLAVVVIFKKMNRSITNFLITTAYKAPIVTFTFGCSAGHLFFYMYDTNCTPNFEERMIIAACGYAFGRGIETLIRGIYKLFENKKSSDEPVDLTQVKK